MLHEHHTPKHGKKVAGDIFLSNELQDIRTRLESAGPRVLIMTGAGVSAASGIPTFRGDDGYWTVGSQNHHPQSLATFAAFHNTPDIVWAWYLHRLAACRRAVPNAAHTAITTFMRAKEHSILITQNVDALHRRARAPQERTYAIHGDLFYMRCSQGCCDELFDMPADIGEAPQPDRISDTQRDELRCPACNAPSRPHVLWFDESYNEIHFRFQSSLKAASSADALIVIGTQGDTHLPNQVALLAMQNGAFLVDIKSAINPFARLAERSGGVALLGSAEDLVPALLA